MPNPRINRYCLFLCLPTFIALSLIWGDGARGAEADPASPFVELALASNPDVGALALQVEALEAAVEARGRWRDPALSLEYAQVPWASPTLGHSPMSGLQVQIQQAIPGPGVLDARQEVARVQGALGSAALEEARSALAGQVRGAYWRLALTRELRMLNGVHVQLVDELLSLTEARYGAGQGGQGALLRLQLRKETLKEETLDLDRDIDILLATLNAAMNRPLDTPIETAPLLEALPPPGG